MSRDVAEPTPHEIDRVRQLLVVRHRREKREASGAHVYADCPFCGKRDKLTLNVDTGMWDCKHGSCGESGSLWRLADQLGVRLREKRMIRSVSSVLRVGLKKQGAKPPKAAIPIGKVEEAHARLWTDDDEDGSKVVGYLRERGIDDDAIRHFKLGVAYMKLDRKAHLSVGIPYVDGQSCALIKMRRLGDGDPRFMRTKGSDSPLFNVAGVRGRKRAVLVEGELDAISLWQCGVTEVASTSLGSKDDIPQQWKESLADAEIVVLWYDDDEAGQKAVDALCSALGTHRVRVAEIPEDLAVEVLNKTGKRPKDVNDLVRAGVDPERVRQIVDDAKSVEVGAVTHVDAFKDAVADVIQAGKAGLGEPSGFRELDKLIRGWRPGEVTYFTGHTGQGKSTFASFCGEVLAHRGIPVLMTAFEDGPLALATRVFRRRYGKPMSAIDSDEEKQRAMDALPRLSEDPIYVVDHYGRVAWDELKDAIRFAVTRLRVGWVLIDHLHFIEKPDRRMDTHEWLEIFGQECAALAVELGVHIAVVAHVHGKVESTVIPTGDAIKGGTGLKQATFLGITVFRVVDMGGEARDGKVKLRDSSGRKHEIELTERDVLLYVWKKRHPDAREGMCVIEFEGASTSYRSKPDEGEAESAEQQPLWGEEAVRVFGDLDGEPDLFGEGVQ